MTPIKKLKDIRESFDFTQKQLADVLGIHPNALQRMEYGTSATPQYIQNYCEALTMLNNNNLLKQHIENLKIETWW